MISLFRKKKARHDPQSHVRAYVIGPLAEALGEAGEGLRLDRLTAATNSDAFHAVYAGGADVVIRWWPWVKDKRKGAEHAYLARLLSENNIPTPEFLLHDDSIATRRRFGGELTVERFVQGATLTPPWSIGEIDSLARLTARLHAIASPIPGKPWRPVNEQADLALYARRQWAKWLAVAQEGVSGEGSKEGSAARALEAGLAWLSGVSSFPLLHGDHSSGNLLRVGTEGIVLLDVNAMFFGCFEQELATIENGLFNGHPDDNEAFFNAYFAETPGEWKAQWAERRDFFHALFHLEKAYSNTRRADKARRKGRTTARALNSPDVARRHWNAFAKAMERF